MECLTIKQLYHECIIQISAGNGDKPIYISRDDEGNGYHGLHYGFLTKPNAIQCVIEDGLIEDSAIKLEDSDKIVILG